MSQTLGGEPESSRVGYNDSEFDKCYNLQLGQEVLSNSREVHYGAGRFNISTSLMLSGMVYRGI